jgi:hypothetical protein
MSPAFLEPVIPPPANTGRSLRQATRSVVKQTPEITGAAGYSITHGGIYVSCSLLRGAERAGLARGPPRRS